MIKTYGMKVVIKINKPLKTEIIYLFKIIKSKSQS